MGLGASLQIGRSGLLASQTGIEVTGNNLANLATPGYHRQSVTLAPTQSRELQRGIFLGQGVQVQQVVRHVDEALEGRIRSSTADQSFSQIQHTILSQIEALQNELSDIDLSTRLGEFFNAFSNLANTPEDNAVRTVVIEEAKTLADFVRNLRSDYTQEQLQLNASLNNAALAANDLLDQIVEVNLQIVKAERGAGGAHGLRDERDVLLGELSQYLDISTVEHPNGTLDIFVGSLPIVLNNVNRGLELHNETVNGQVQVQVRIQDDASLLKPTTGSIAGLLDARDGDLGDAIDALDQFSAQLIFQLNRVHSQGQALQGFEQVTGASQVIDATAALSATASGLEFFPQHGSFQLHITEQSTGQRTTTTIPIDLDGIAPAGDTTLTSLAATINAVANITASVTTDGRLQITAASNHELSFSDDTSGALAALGIHTFFTGHNASNIQLNSVVQQDPGMIATAQQHIPGDNRTALSIAGLREQSIAELGNFSLTEFWSRHIQDMAVRTGQAKQNLEADTIVRENLQAQQQAVSGVNADEEAINLLVFQRAYQGSARFISVVDELLETLLSLL